MALRLLSREFVPPIVGVDALLGALVGVSVLIGGLALSGAGKYPRGVSAEHPDRFLSCSFPPQSW